MPKIRLIDEEGNQVGIVNTREALERAQDTGLDLVEISPNAEPPVCRIMDYGKFLFEQSKKLTAQRKKQKQIQIKEIKFRPGTDVGDYNVKLRKVHEFLEEGNRVKISLRFRGREMQHRELGLELLERLSKDLNGIGTVEVMPKLEGRQMIMLLAPAKLAEKVEKSEKTA